MPKSRLRIEVAEKAEAYDVTVDLEADPAIVAQGVAAKLGLPTATRYFRLKDSFILSDGVTLELVPDTTDPFTLHGPAT